ncbi:MAG: ABC transporter substrate-binding protein [Candidatus Tectomicrobia bacterium]|nr:ABC transporter substrate-binding protein [Candidatus Tectomicrobia bacterium]
MRCRKNFAQLRIVLLGLALLVGLLGVLLAAAKVSAEAVKIRLGHGEAPNDITAIVFLNKQVLKHAGTSYVVDPIHFRAPPATFPALAAKELDLTYMSFPGFASLVGKAKLDVKIVADIMGYADAEGSHSWVVREDSPIKKLEDLRGKTLGTNALGTGIDFAARNLLRKHGLEYPKDYQFIEVNFPNQEVMVREGKIDVGVLLIPLWHRAKAKGGLRRLFTSFDGTGRTQQLSLIARTEFLTQHRQAMQDFIDDWLRSVRWYLDPKNRDEAIRITSRFTKIPEAAFKAWAFGPGDVYRDPDGFPDLLALQKNLDDLYSLGMTTFQVDVLKHVDLSFVRSARMRLK